jgi:thiopeptide-type bacteriocin biosynthesis protein
MPITYLTEKAGDRAGLDPRNVGSLLGAFDDKLLLAALAIANPGVHSALERIDAVEPDSRLARTLHHYLVRLSSRATPFGLFAGVGLIGWGPTTDAVLVGGRPTTRTRPDMKWLTEFVGFAEADIEIRRHLSYWANSAVYQRGGRIFALSRGDDSRPRWDTVSVRSTRVARQAILLARNSITHHGLVKRLVDDSNASVEKVEKLVEQLWSRQFLTTDLLPPLTSGDPAAHVADRLARIPAAAAAYETLQGLLSAMAAFDAGVLATIDDYRALQSSASRLGVDFAADPPQVDMGLSLAGTSISSRVAAEAARAADILLQVSPTPFQTCQIDAYRSRFESRYGQGRAIPLLELLDPNFGLGSPYAAPDVPVPDHSSRNRALTEIAVNALIEKRSEVVLNSEMLARLRTESSTTSPPPSLDIAVSVLASSADDIDNGLFTLVVGANLGAPTAGRNLGRFADLLGTPAFDALAQVSPADRRSHTGIVCAELVYSPAQTRWANLAVRPHFSDYEIVVAATPGVPPQRVIALHELDVEAVEGRFRIWWTAGNAEVRVTAGHMLNEMSAPDVVRFLVDAQRCMHGPYRPFDWGDAALLPALPRMQFGRIVLCPARFRAADLITKSVGTVTDFAAAVDQWRRRWGVPRYVHVGSGDHRLLVDLETEFGLNGLRLELRRFTRREPPIVEEALPTPEQVWLHGPGGRYVAEIVVPLMRIADAPSKIAAAPTAPTRVHATDRLRAPGSDWLYCKLYCPTNAEEEVLCDTVGMLCDPLTASGLVHDWFFVRYSDPDPHLRFRFRGEPEVLMTAVLPRLCAWNQQLIDRDLCVSAAIDTYCREVERYKGLAGMDYSEKVFGADSRAVATLLSLRRAGAFDLDPVVLAAITVHDLLAHAGYENSDQLDWTSAIVSRIPAPYPSLRSEIRQVRGVLCRGLGRSTGDAEINTVLAARRHELGAMADRINSITSGESTTRDDLLHSHIHMHCNRLLGRDRAAEAHALIVLQKALYGIAVA